MYYENKVVNYDLNVCIFVFIAAVLGVNTYAYSTFGQFFFSAKLCIYFVLLVSVALAARAFNANQNFVKFDNQTFLFLVVLNLICIAMVNLCKPDVSRQFAHIFLNANLLLLVGAKIVTLLRGSYVKIRDSVVFCRNAKQFAARPVTECLHAPYFATHLLHMPFESILYSLYSDCHKIDIFVIYGDNHDRELKGLLLFMLKNNLPVITNLKLEATETYDMASREIIFDPEFKAYSLKFFNPAHLWIKRVLDIFAAAVGLIITAGIALVVYPVVYAQSPGNLIYKHVRIGQNNKPFTLYKIRTMCCNADALYSEVLSANLRNGAGGVMFKAKADPRVYPFGWLLRKTYIDEFPQFWNVLKGEMSLIGPRPSIEREFMLYEPHMYFRLYAQPGISGLWQTNPQKDSLEFREVLDLDKYYIKNWSLQLDFKIMFNSLYTILSKSGDK